MSSDSTLVEEEGEQSSSLWSEDGLGGNLHSATW